MQGKHGQSGLARPVQSSNQCTPLPGVVGFDPAKFEPLFDRCKDSRSLRGTSFCTSARMLARFCSHAKKHSGDQHFYGLVKTFHNGQRPPCSVKTLHPTACRKSSSSTTSACPRPKNFSRSLSIPVLARESHLSATLFTTIR